MPTAAQVASLFPGIVPAAPPQPPAPTGPTSAGEALAKIARGLPSSAFRRSLPEGNGRAHEYRLDFSDLAADDGHEVFNDELLGERGDFCCSYIPAGLGILGPLDRFGLDLRFRGDVGREEARAIVRAIVKELTDETAVDSWYDHWEKQKAARGLDSRDVDGLTVHCLGGWANSGEPFARALDSIPDHARATLAAYWRRLEDERGAGFPLVSGGGAKHADGLPSRDFGGVVGDGGSFVFDPALSSLPLEVATSAAVLLLAHAHMMATGSTIVSYLGMVPDFQRRELDALAESWGADLKAMREIHRTMTSEAGK